MVELLELLVIGCLSFSKFFLKLFNFFFVISLILSNFFIIFFINSLEFFIPFFSFFSNSSFECFSFNIVDIFKLRQRIFWLLLGLSQLVHGILFNIFYFIFHLSDFHFKSFLNLRLLFGGLTVQFFLSLTPFRFNFFHLKHFFFHFLNLFFPFTSFHLVCHFHFVILFHQIFESFNKSFIIIFQHFYFLLVLLNNLRIFFSLTLVLTFFILLRVLLAWKSIQDSLMSPLILFQLLFCFFILNF